MANILITGATGFIGNHLARFLVERGDNVCCLVRPRANTEPLESLGVSLVRGSLEDRESIAYAMRGVEYVYHLAGLIAAVRRSKQMQVNGIGTANVVWACARQQTVPVMVYCSSIAASGPTSRERVRTESDRPRPVSRYGHSKRAGELAAERAAHRVPITIVRPGIVFGPGDRELLPVFHTLRWLRSHIIAGLRPPPLSWIYVEDLVRLLVAAGEQGRRLPPVTGSDASNGQGCYFACAPEWPDFAQFGRIIRPFVQRPHAWLLYFPEPFPWIFAGINEVRSRVLRQPPHFSIDKIREAIAESWACSPEAARRELDFQTSASLADQFQTTVRWYQEEGWLKAKRGDSKSGDGVGG